MRKYGLLILIGLLLFLTACGYEIENPHNWEVQEFAYINQDGEEVALEDLKGKVWLANFIFTNCDTVCPPMTANMSKIQGLLKQEGIENVEIVSFTVDPEVDTPDALKEFAGKFEADFSNWHFLTGYSQDEIESFSRESFKSLVQKIEGEPQVGHGTSFYVVDKDGIIKQSYSGVDVPFDQIIKDVKSLN
ncbi:SCO family protein [Cytobacillus suaedae]|nr:SCO family protein [Cytobacillus suaedae]